MTRLVATIHEGRAAGPRDWARYRVGTLPRADNWRSDQAQMGQQKRAREPATRPGWLLRAPLVFSRKTNLNFRLCCWRHLQRSGRDLEKKSRRRVLKAETRAGTRGFTVVPQFSTKPSSRQALKLDQHACGGSLVLAVSETLATTLCRC
jgi:hypothetical protein